MVGSGDAVEPTEAAAGEARDGVTPPMRNARERVFRKHIDVAPQVVQKVEYDLLTILAVSGGIGGQQGQGQGQAAWSGGGNPVIVPPRPPTLDASLLLSHAQGGAPEGLKFVDTEEEWVVDAATGQGAWLPVRR